jgi:hypothetical protein
LEQLAYAVSQQRTLVTHNRADFERLALEYFSSGITHYGIIVAVRRPIHEIAKRLLTILDCNGGRDDEPNTLHLTGAVFLVTIRLRQMKPKITARV